MATVVGLLACGPAHASDDEHPSFLQAGIFFITGLEPPDIKFLAPDSALNDGHQVFYNGAYSTVPVSYQLKPDKPCMIFGYMFAPPYTNYFIDFDNLPGPRAAKFEYSTLGNILAYMKIPSETICRAKSKPIRDAQGRPALERIDGTTMCDDGMLITSNTIRRLKALDYIRANFCAGQPEPPPPPPKAQRPY
jgi:hypothetical protein